MEGGVRGDFDEGLHDRLSELPDCLIQCIVNCLPLGDAVRTRLLSKKLSHYWKGIEVLKFDESFNKDFIEGKEKGYHDLMESIFVSLNGPVLEFELCIPPSVNKINMLDSVTNRRRGLMLPSHVYNSSRLTKLSLENCELTDPPFYMFGFSNLVSLSLVSVTVEVILLEPLICKSPKLKSLVLIGLKIVGNDHLVVDARELRTLEYRSSQSSLRLNYLPCLTSATIHSKVELAAGKLERSPFQQFFSLMPNIKELNLGNTAVSSLIGTKVPENVQKVLVNLVATPKMLSCAMSLIRTSLNLKKLDFNFEEAILRTSPDEEAGLQFKESELLDEMEASCSRCLNSGEYNEVLVSIREIARTAITIREKRNDALRDRCSSIHTETSKGG